jgi:hypothetical protein
MTVASFDKGKDSLNLIELPLTVFSKVLPNYSAQVGNKLPISVTDKITRQKIYGYIEISLPSRSGHIYSAVGPREEDVFIALMEYTYLKRMDRHVRFDSLNEILKLLGWSDGGKSYLRLVEAMENLNAVTIKTDLFWDNVTKTYKTHSFHVLDNVAYDYADRTGRPVKNKKKSGFFVWNDVLYSNFDAGYLKNIDTGLYRKIGNPAARKLFRIFDKRFYKHKQLFLRTEYLCVDIMRFNRQGEWFYRRRLKTYCDELKKVGFLGDYWFGQKNGFNYIFLERAGTQQEMFDPGDHINVDDPETIQVFESLLGAGVDERVAAEVINMRDLTFVAKWIDCFDKGFRKADNPAAYIVDAIKKDYTLPVEYQKYLDKIKGNEERRVKLDMQANCPICKGSGFIEVVEIRDGKEIIAFAPCTHKVQSETPLFSQH